MLNKNQTADVRITGYTSEGEGVCRINGRAVFVPNAIRGERCMIRITHAGRNALHGKIEEILEKSPHRISRPCPEAKLCGGCCYHHMDYAEELVAKAQKVTDALVRIGGQDMACLHPGDYTGEGPQLVPITGADGIRFMPEGQGERPEDMGTRGEMTIRATAEKVPPEALAYRNKAQYPLAVKNGKAVAGFYKSRTHQVIPIERCAILPEEFDRGKDAILRWANENHVSVYDERTGMGLLRHIYLRKGVVSGQIMVCIVANGERLPQENRLVKVLRSAIPALASVILSVNRKDTNVVLGEEFRTLWGQAWIEDELCGFTFRLSPRSFYQVNHDQAQRLYNKAIEFADLHGTETVLDLYCGTGTITLALSRKAGRVVGVEIVPQAIEDAGENAGRNGVTNVEFFCADASVAAARFNAEGKRPDVIVVDPPRKGLAPDVIDSMVAMQPERIVYVSCDPATLARDVKLFSGKGYALARAEAFDLFPRTFHVETVVSLSQLKSEV